MSASQFSAAASQESNPKNLNIRVYFIYDYPVHFSRLFPTAEYMGVGAITDWEFHVNEIGKANIRPIFDSRKNGSEPLGNEYLLPFHGIKNGTFDISRSKPMYGLVFGLSKQDDPIAKEIFMRQKDQRTRLSCKACVTKTGAWDSSKAFMAVSVFADFHHTGQVYNPDFLRPEAEEQRWIETLTVFQRLGVPQEYLSHVKNELNGCVSGKISPIYVDPKAYTPTMHPKQTQEPAGKELKADRTSLPPKAIILQENYFKAYSTLAPAIPTNEKEAEVFEDYHRGIMRSQVNHGMTKLEHLQVGLSLYDRISDRCDDGLDVFDAMRESRDERSWRHPNPEKEGAERAPPKAVPKAPHKKPSAAVKRKQPPQKAQLPRWGASASAPAKRQNVQRPGASPAAVRQDPGKSAAGALDDRAGARK